MADEQEAPNDEGSTQDEETPKDPPVGIDILKTYDEAQLREVVEYCKRTKGKDHPDTILVTTYLVVCLIDNKKHHEALPLAEHELKYMQRMGDYQFGGRTCSGMVCATSNLGRCMQGLGRFEEAEQFHCDALNIAQRELGYEDPITIICCGRLANCWQMMPGKAAQAEAMHRRELDFHMRLLGPEHMESINTRVTLGMGLLRTGKQDEAVRLLHKALELNIRANGLQHEDTICTMLGLSKALMATLDYVQAERTLRRGLDLSTNLLGIEHPLTISNIVDLGALYINTGRLEEALPLCRQGLELHRKESGEDHPDTLHALCTLANLLGGMGNIVEAEPVAKTAHEACLRVLGTDHADTKHAASMVRSLTKALARSNRVPSGKRRGKG